MDSLYHFHAQVSLRGVVTSIDGVWRGTLNEMEDFDRFKNQLRVSYNIDEWNHLSITSLTKLS